MKNLHELDQYRLEMPPDMLSAMNCTAEYDPSRNGAFEIPYGRVTLRVIAGGGGGWDHVSVSLAVRCPTWDEMEHIAKLFFEDDEVAMQLHLPANDHINIHPFVLHWWRPRSKLKKIPLPPKSYV